MRFFSGKMRIFSTMSGFRFIVLLALCLQEGKATKNLDDNVENNHTCKHTLKEVEMFSAKGLCSPEIKVDSAMILSLPKMSFFMIPTCVNCSITLVAPRNRQIVVTLFVVGTETSPSGKCDLNKLDIYDGDSVNEGNRLSDADGICGCKFPSGGEFKSSNNTLTLHYQTTCKFTRIHGELELVITAVNNDLFNTTHCRGDFECRNRECIDKNLVCNGEYDCKDHSDEIDCHIRNGTCPGQFECLNGSCIDKNLVCNGKNDCHDGSDEKGCHKHPTNGTCPGKFECSDGNCIDKNKVCNGKNDCPDKSDEKGCHMNINRVLLYVLLGLAGLIAILLIIVIIVLCCKYCCISFRMASVYRKLS